jgi:hypothetical protein
MVTLERFVPGASQSMVVDLADQFARVNGRDSRGHPPITALSSTYGMNVIVNDRTHVVQLGVVLVVMAQWSLVLLRWTRRQGWW